MPENLMELQAKYPRMVAELREVLAGAIRIVDDALAIDPVEAIEGSGSGATVILDCLRVQDEARAAQEDAGDLYRWLISAGEVAYQASREQGQ